MHLYFILTLLCCGVYGKFPLEISPDLNEECQQQMDEFFKTTKLWPIKMADAWAKLPSGLLEGNIRDFGNFGECLKIDEEYDNGRILGKYCTFGMNISLGEIPIFDSICVPDKCDPETLFAKRDWVSFSNLGCQTKETGASWTWDDWTVLGVLCFIAFLMTISTIYDAYLHQNKLKAPHPALLSFSIVTNTKKIVATNNSPDQLHCLNGLRVISLMWVLAGHRFGLLTYIPVDNLTDLLDWTKQWYSAYIQGALVSVDTFFFLSAFLTSYMYFKNMKQGKKNLDIFGIPKYYFHRLFRITPALAAVYFIYITILRRLSSGPLWPISFAIYRDICTRNWWSFFLYIQNYYNYTEMCIIPTWYLSADMQLFILSPLFILPLGYVKKNYSKIKTYAVACAAVILAVIIALVPEFFRDNDNGYETHARLSTYLIGIFMGMYVIDVRDKKNIINPLINLITWIVILIGMGAIVYFTYEVSNNPGTEKKIWFFALSRPCWAIGLCWIVYACITGNGGVVNWFLSRPIFQVLTRLNYSLYLVHGVNLNLQSAMHRHTIHFSDYTVFYYWCGDFISGLLIAYVWVLAFESPMIGIEKLILGGVSQSPAPAKKCDDVAVVKALDSTLEVPISINKIKNSANEKPTKHPNYYTTPETNKTD